MNPTSTNAFLNEYSQRDAVKRYVTKTAGAGISHLLNYVYGPIYERYIDLLVKQRTDRSGWRVLEYGCGGGMNLIHVLKIFKNRSFEIETAIGADFAEAMINAAREEADQVLSPAENKQVRFAVAPNESLSKDIATGLSVPVSRLDSSFDLIFGVNTFRYCHRIGSSDACASDIFKLLRPGGISIMIDMNNKFPLFRSRLKDKMTKPSDQVVLPTVAEYRGPFERAGFSILEVRNFCWIPHSAKGLGFSICKALDPILSKVIPTFAMRTIVVGQKPES